MVDNFFLRKYIYRFLSEGTVMGMSLKIILIISSFFLTMLAYSDPVNLRGRSFSADSRVRFYITIPSGVDKETVHSLIHRAEDCLSAGITAALNKEYRVEFFITELHEQEIPFLPPSAFIDPQDENAHSLARPLEVANELFLVFSKDIKKIMSVPYFGSSEKDKKEVREVESLSQLITLFRSDSKKNAYLNKDFSCSSLSSPAEEYSCWNVQTAVQRYGKLRAEFEKKPHSHMIAIPVNYLTIENQTYAARHFLQMLLLHLGVSPRHITTYPLSGTPASDDPEVIEVIGQNFMIDLISANYAGNPKFVPVCTLDKSQANELINSLSHLKLAEFR